MANTSYAALKQYILRKLGSPVINIELTDDQLEDCIDESVYDFRKEHMDGVHTGYLPIQLQTDITTYPLDDNIHEVLNILSSSSLAFGWHNDDPLLISSFYAGNEHISLGRESLVDVEVFRQQYKMVSDYFEVPLEFDYNSITHKIHLYAPPENTINAFIKVYMSEDDETESYLSDQWVKNYATALARLQWGDNLSKFTQVNLPGGSQFNYDGIISRAQADIEKLKEELEDEYSLPLDPEVG